MEHALGTWGQPALTEWPYDPEADPEGIIPDSAGTPPWHLADLTPVPLNPDAILNALVRGQVPMVMIEVRDSFYLPAGRDELDHLAAEEKFYGNHAVVVVAAATRAEQSWYLIRNSWGEDWGSNGYAWVSAGYLESTLVDAAVLESTTPDT
ncbi:C1 family peptidase [Leifsonia sp. NPDC102414]|uniref:C1 family peptidase n=1 Tax=Leifsonia sp. NPDC102414 TaxID=3364124 RepID=UPI00382AF9D6